MEVAAAEEEAAVAAAERVVGAISKILSCSRKQKDHEEHDGELYTPMDSIEAFCPIATGASSIVAIKNNSQQYEHRTSSIRRRKAWPRQQEHQPNGRKLARGKS